MIKTVVMGYGTTDSSVTKIFDKNRDVIASQAGQEAKLRYILDLREFLGSPVADKIVHDFKVAGRDEEMKVAAEIMDGLNPAYPFMRTRLMAGKNVVVSDKALVMAYGIELLIIVRKRHVNFFFEASVDGGISIIHPLYRCLMSEHIGETMGISNGTTNFILTKMDKEGESFEDALREAWNLGHTERNPEAGVEGHDTCRKIATLTAMVTGKEVDYEDIYIGGIMRITDIDFKYAERVRASVKLFGTNRIGDDKVLVYTTLVMISKTSPLYSVNDVFNGTLVRGGMLGASIFHGSGVGKLPTGSAVVVDIIEAAQNLREDVPMGWTGGKQATESMNQAQFGYSVRVVGSYRDKEQDVKNAFGQVGVIELYRMDEFTFLTAQVAEGEFRKAAVSHDSRGQERSEYGIEQIIYAVLQRMASAMSRIIGEITRQGFPRLFHLLTGLYYPSCGGTRAFQASLADNLLLGIRYHPLIAYVAVVPMAELVSFAVPRVAENPRYYLRHERLLVYTGVAIVLVNWVYKNYMLVVRGVDLLPLWLH